MDDYDGNKMELVARGPALELRLSYAALCVRRRVPRGPSLAETLRGVLAYARFCIDKDTVVVMDEVVSDALRELRQDEAYWAEYQRQVRANAARLQPAYQEGDEWDFPASMDSFILQNEHLVHASSTVKECSEESSDSRLGSNYIIFVGEEG